MALRHKPLGHDARTFSEIPDSERDRIDLGLYVEGGTGVDSTANILAVFAANPTATRYFLPSDRIYKVKNLTIPAGIDILGVSGRSKFLIAPDAGSDYGIRLRSGSRLSGFDIEASSGSTYLLQSDATYGDVNDVTLENLRIIGTGTGSQFGLATWGSGAKNRRWDINNVHGSGLTGGFVFGHLEDSYIRNCSLTDGAIGFVQASGCYVRYSNVQRVGGVTGFVLHNDITGQGTLQGGLHDITFVQCNARGVSEESFSCDGAGQPREYGKFGSVSSAGDIISVRFDAIGTGVWPGSTTNIVGAFLLPLTGAHRGKKFYIYDFATAAGQGFAKFRQNKDMSDAEATAFAVNDLLVIGMPTYNIKWIGCDIEVNPDARPGFPAYPAGIHMYSMVYDSEAIACTVNGLRAATNGVVGTGVRVSNLTSVNAAGSYISKSSDANPGQLRAPSMGNRVALNTCDFANIKFDFIDFAVGPDVPPVYPFTAENIEFENTIRHGVLIKQQFVTGSGLAKTVEGLDYLIHPVNGALGVGAGNTSPSAPLDVKGAYDTTSGIVARFEGNSSSGSFLHMADTTNNWRVGMDASTGAYAWHAGGYPGFAGTRTVTITQTGKIGIGVAAPVDRIDIAGIAYAPNQNGGLRICTPGSEMIARFALKTDVLGNARLALDAPTGVGTVVEGLTINSSGYVGIGVASSPYRLKVNGVLCVSPGASATPANDGELVFEFTNATTVKLKGRQSGAVKEIAWTLA